MWWQTLRYRLEFAALAAVLSYFAWQLAPWLFPPPHWDGQGGGFWLGKVFEWLF
jgi:hypothetical protein